MYSIRPACTISRETPLPLLLNHPIIVTTRVYTPWDYERDYNLYMDYPVLTFADNFSCHRCWISLGHDYQLTNPLLILHAHDLCNVSLYNPYSSLKDL